PGETERYDTEYVRNGTCDIFMFNAPLLGWRRAEVTERRTREDWARQIKKLADEDFPDAKKITLVMDNLNTHNPASLYETFQPEEAKRIRDRLEIHYTPKHGSDFSPRWLNMAEIEFSVLNNHGLSDRIPAIEQMRREVNAWNKIRNKKSCKINWRFTTADAQIKLARLYPLFES
ncbi:MAG: transposase, partial [Treponema sp.]|nr:transposase [Treponema sp.]